MWLPQFEGCVGVGVCLLVGGDLFKVHTQALKGNEFSTLLFATIQLLKAMVIDLLAVSERALIRHHR
jgi:ferredoxin